VGGSFPRVPIWDEFARISPGGLSGAMARVFPIV